MVIVDNLWLPVSVDAGHHPGLDLVDHVAVPIVVVAYVLLI